MNAKQLKSTALAVFSLALLMSCENPMRLETKVHEDGSLDKTILFEKIHSEGVTKNIFGVNAKSGWAVESNPIEAKPDTGKSKNKDYRVSFRKTFPSVTELNAELNADADSLFHVKASFEKKFRWFYTYIRYSETFRPLNRFKAVSPGDFFNQEDNAFIDRLPAEGKKISKADSLYLQLLNEKIYDRFATMGIFKEEFEILEEVIRRNGIDKKWIDTLYKKSEFVYNQIDKMKGDKNFAERMADTLGIPLRRPQSTNDFKERSKDLKQRIDFMSFARDGKYVNVIEMPWTVSNSNADSVAGNQLYWRPLVTRFAYRDYEMFAESRKLNLWACLVSLVVIAITGYLFLKAKK
jgi:hypothetical protein